MGKETTPISRVLYKSLSFWYPFHFQWSLCSGVSWCRFEVPGNEQEQDNEHDMNRKLKIILTFIILTFMTIYIHLWFLDFFIFYFLFMFLFFYICYPYIYYFDVVVSRDTNSCSFELTKSSQDSRGPEA